MADFKALIRKSYEFRQGDYDNHISKWNILEKLYTINFEKYKPTTPKIPKLIHQIWLGSKFPDKYKAWAESWKEHNPDWEYKLWTDDNIDEIQMPNRKQYDTISNYGPKSDYLRYHILNQFGGLYVDTDFECVKSFDDLRGLDFFTGIGYPMKPELYVGLIGSIPHHPITEMLVREVSKGDRDVLLENVLKVISSYFFTRVFFTIVGEYMPGVAALPMDYFYPFPNSKGHDRKNGKDFIQPCSYAVHHWEVSWAIKSGKVDWIQGDRFKEIADFTYSPITKHKDDYDKLENTFNPSELKDVNIIYTHTFYVEQLFNIIQHLNGKFVIITHNSDMNINGSIVIPDNVIKWFTQNAHSSDKKIQALPIGLPNDRWDKSKLRKIFMNEQIKSQRRIKNLVYVNHSVKTNPFKRAEVYDRLKGKSWATLDIPSKDIQNYIKNIYSHKFVICPEGNGLDTHRLWETLYLGSIPIVIRDAHTKYWEDLPICFIDCWCELNEDFLNKEYDRIKAKDWPYEKLNFEYWRKAIYYEAKRK